MPAAETASKLAEKDVFDDLDDIFDYDVHAPISNFAPDSTKEKQSSASKSKSTAGLGIDEEVEVAKRARRPRAKLDENRLLSQKGIPTLRDRAKKQLKFKGKGHEYSDTARLLSFYQLWLDDLFPKAKFLDAAAMVEKLGHKKRIQIMRMEWINEGKPRSSVHEDSLFDEPELPSQENSEREKTAPRVASIFEKRASERSKTPVPNADVEMEDLYDATPRAVKQKPSAGGDSQDSIFGGGTQSLFGPAKTAAEEVPEDDELDALLAEEAHDAKLRKNYPGPEREHIIGGGVAAPLTEGDDDMWDDDDDALAEMLADEKELARDTATLNREDDEDEDAMEAMAEMDLEI